MAEKKVDNKIEKILDELLENEGIDKMKFIEERKKIDEATKRLGHRVQKAKNQRKISLSREYFNRIGR